MPTTDIPVLASGSRIRFEMLLRAGVATEVVPARINEDDIKREWLRNGATTDIAAIAGVLAEQKSIHVSRNYPGRLVIGADQILDLDGVLINKPVDYAQARAQLVMLSGRPHELISAVSITRDGREVWRHMDRARLWVRDLSEKFIDDYLNQLGDAAFTSPGSYQVEGIGVQLFDRIDGNHYTILGMPLLPLLTYLRTQHMIPS